MKIYGMLLVLFGLIIESKLSAQTSSYQIKGVIVDSVTNKFLDYATINLKNSEKLNRSMVTANDGSFIFSNLPLKEYTLTIVSLGYNPKKIVVKADSTNSEIDLGKIFLNPTTVGLKEVVITLQAPLVKHEVDRISYNVQADPESKSANVLDMLRKVPLVTVDGDDNIQIKGDGNYRVLINGRTSSIVARDPKDVFRSMPAAHIEKIEIITTPPAKYDGEGLAGIINIITHKKIDNGYNASVGSSYKFPNGPRANGSYSYKSNKFGLSTFGSFVNYKDPVTRYENFRTGFIPSQSQLDQDGEYQSVDNSTSLSTELSYEVDSLRLITASIGVTKNDNNSSGTFYTSQIGNDSQFYRLGNTGDKTWNGYDVGVNYQIGFKRNKNQLLTVSYKFNSHNNDQFNRLRLSDTINYARNDYNQTNDSGVDEQTIQVDYTHPRKNIDIEGGMKGILRNNYSNYQSEEFNPVANTFIVNQKTINNFEYIQNVYSLYNSYLFKLEKYTIKAGVRMERTAVNADFESKQTVFSKYYNNLIPSISLLRRFGPIRSVSLGYTQRIQRPSISQLNPFVDEVDPKFVRTGNVNLKPVLNHSFSLNYNSSGKKSFNVGLSYTFANNTIQYVSTFGANNITTVTYENIGENKNLGVNINTRFAITKQGSFNLNSQLSYLWVEGAANGKIYSNEGILGSAFAGYTYKFKQDWKSTLNLNYFSPNITLQGTTTPYYYSSLNISKDFYKKKMNVSAQVSNPFRSRMDYWKKINTDEFTQNTSNMIVYRRFNLSYFYRFGRLKQSIKKNKRGINNDDIKIDNVTPD